MKVSGKRSRGTFVVKRNKESEAKRMAAYSADYRNLYEQLRQQKGKGK